jgi:hypothetical protein
MNPRLLLTFTLVLGTLGLASGAEAAAPSNLWATVNVCDTAASPNQMGVRARMPGNGKRERMYMRFSAQFQSGKAWKPVSGKGVSRWLFAGSAIYKTQEMGYTFSFDTPKAGTSYLMRGVVEFQRRKGKKVVYRRHLYTAAGHRSQGADPKGYSSATCRIQ